MAAQTSREQQDRERVEHKDGKYKDLKKFMLRREGDFEAQTSRGGCEPLSGTGKIMFML